MAGEQRCPLSLLGLPLRRLGQLLLGRLLLLALPHCLCAVCRSSQLWEGLHVGRGRRRASQH